GMVVQLLCLRRLLAEGIRPDLVLVEAHPWFLYRGYNTHVNKHYLAVQRVREEDLEVLGRYDPEADEVRKEGRRHAWLPWYPDVPASRRRRRGRPHARDEPHAGGVLPGRAGTHRQSVFRPRQAAGRPGHRRAVLAPRRGAV